MFYVYAILNVWHTYGVNIFIHLHHHLLESFTFSIINHFIQLSDQNSFQHGSKSS